MIVSKELKDRIDVLFEMDPEMIDRLYNCDVNAIREIGYLSQRGINPVDVIEAYEGGDSDAINYLYQQAMRLVGLQELYRDLCLEFCNNKKDLLGYDDVCMQKRSIKK